MFPMTRNVCCNKIRKDLISYFRSTPVTAVMNMVVPMIAVFITNLMTHGHCVKVG